MFEDHSKLIVIVVWFFIAFMLVGGIGIWTFNWLLH